VPSPIVPPSGCRFHPRCRYATKICAQQEPPLAEYGGGHLAACHHPLNIDLPAAPGTDAAPVPGAVQDAAPVPGGASSAVPAADAEPLPPVGGGAAGAEVAPEEAQ